MNEANVVIMSYLREGVKIGSLILQERKYPKNDLYKHYIFLDPETNATIEMKEDGALPFFVTDSRIKQIIQLQYPK